MRPIQTPPPAVMATCARALQVAGHCEQLAAALRQAAAEILAATPPPHGGDALAPPAGRSHIAAVARCGTPQGPVEASRVLGAGVTVASRPRAAVVTAKQLSLEDANDELRAAARYGSWQPPAVPKPSVRASTARKR